jgi:hypothetical protein
VSAAAVLAGLLGIVTAQAPALELELGVGSPFSSLAARLATAEGGLRAGPRVDLLDGRGPRLSAELSLRLGAGAGWALGVDGLAGRSLGLGARPAWEGQLGPWLRLDLDAQVTIELRAQALAVVGVERDQRSVVPLGALRLWRPLAIGGADVTLWFELGWMGRPGLHRPLGGLGLLSRWGGPGDRR